MRKVLIVTYYWPPAGGPGVQRWLKFAKYLPDYGIKPIIYTPENPTYPIVDTQIADELPQNITVIKNKIVEPYGLASFFSKSKTKTISSGLIPAKYKQTKIDRLLLWVRGNLFIPDARVMWVNPSVRFLEQYILENSIDTIITTGPPHSLHLIGFRLKQKINIQWLADFRDPWTTIGYHKALKLSLYAQNKHQQLELKILRTADKIITTSRTTRNDFVVKTSKPIEVLTNGFDIQKTSPRNLDTKFSIAHIGSFLLDRNPLILWKCLKELCQENELFKSHFQLKLIGKISDEILTTINAFGLEDYLLNLGYIAHEEALVHQRNSQVLLLIEIDSLETRCIIPGKLFEYLVSERPIIALGPQDSDIEPIIVSTNTGKYFEYDQKDALKETILAYFELYLHQNLKVYPVGLQMYSRKSITQKLSDFIQK